MHVDVTRAFLYADASREIFMKLPVEDQEDGEEQMCGRLPRAMYGSRDAAQNWQRKCVDTVKERVLHRKGVAVPFLQQRPECVRTGAWR